MGSRVEFPFSRTTNSFYGDLVNVGEKTKKLHEKIVSKTLRTSEHMLGHRKNGGVKKKSFEVLLLLLLLCFILLWFGFVFPFCFLVVWLVWFVLVSLFFKFSFAVCAAGEKRDRKVRWISLNEVKFPKIH